MIMPVETSESKSPIIRKSGEVSYDLSIVRPMKAKTARGPAIAMPTSNANAISSALVSGAFTHRV